MKKAVGVARFLSFLVFLAALILAYAYLGEQVTVFNEEGDGGTISRETFFYIGIGAFMGINIVMTALAAMLYRFPYREGGLYKSKAHKETVANWLVLENVFLNMLMVFAIVFIGIYNNAESINPGGFGYLIYFGFGLVAYGLIQLIIKLFSFKY